MLINWKCATFSSLAKRWIFFQFVLFLNEVLETQFRNKDATMTRLQQWGVRNENRIESRTSETGQNNSNSIVLSRMLTIKYSGGVKAVLPVDATALWAVAYIKFCYKYSRIHHWKYWHGKTYKNSTPTSVNCYQQRNSTTLRMINKTALALVIQRQCVALPSLVWNSQLTCEYR